MPLKLTTKQIANALVVCEGKVALAAESLGVTYQCIDKRIRHSDSLSKLHKHLNEIDLDNMEFNLIKAARELKPAAIIYFLKSKGKNRGWGEDIEVFEGLSDNLALLASKLPD